MLSLFPRRSSAAVIGLSALTAISALSGTAAAGVNRIVYTFTGTVTSTPSAPSSWAGTSVGDSFAIAMIVYTDATPATSTPTMRTFDLFGPDPLYLRVGPSFFDVRWEGGATGLSALIANDDGSMPARDELNFYSYVFDGADGEWTCRVRYSETAATPPVPTGLLGVGWPDAGGLDPSSWASATIRLAGPELSEDVVLAGVIESARVQDFDCWEIDYNADGQVDFSDYLEFLNYYVEGNPRADLCGCGLVDFSSYLEFLGRYDSCGE